MSFCLIIAAVLSTSNVASVDSCISSLLFTHIVLLVDEHDHSWLTLKTTHMSADGTPYPVKSTVSKIGTEGEQFESADVSLTVPEGGVSSATALSCKTNLDLQLMLPVDSNQEVIPSS